MTGSPAWWGTPFVGLGHNNFVAWTCTTGDPDTSDIYAEKVDPNNPMRYKVNDEWRDFEVRNFELRITQGDSIKEWMRREKQQTSRAPQVSRRSG